jgi:hypothetical protein
MLDTTKGVKLYAAEDGTYYYFEPDKSKIELGSNESVDKPIRVTDDLMGTSTGDVNGEFVGVEWVQSYTHHILFSLIENQKTDSYKSWALMATVKNMTTAQQDDALLEQTAKDLKAVKPPPTKSNNRIIYGALVFMALVTGFAIWYKSKKDKKQAALPTLDHAQTVQSISPQNSDSPTKQLKA